MKASLRHRRHAERFAQLLDEAGGGRRHRVRTRLDDELAGLVALRQELAAARPEPEIDPEFRTGLRAMLVATAEREGIGTTAEPERLEPAPSRPARSRQGLLARAPRARTAVIAGVAAGAVAFAGMSTASENAVPGDALYGVKRSTERAQLALASSDIGRGELYLDFARTRLTEAQAISGGLDRVLADMDSETSQGIGLLTRAAVDRQDLSALDAVDGFTESQVAGLTELADRVSGDDLMRVRTSLELLDAVAARSADLRQALQECETPRADTVDSLGPVPSACVSLPTPGALPPLTNPDAPQSPQWSSGEPAGEQRPLGQAPTSPTGPTGAPAPSDEADQPSAEPEQPDGGDGSPQPPADAEDTADDGLLDGLGRLVGNLLGG